MTNGEGRWALNISGALVGMGLVGILAFVAWALVYKTVPPENENSFSTLLGILSAQVGMVVGFYFGSSIGNKKQSDAIASQAETIKVAQQALNPGTADAIVLPPGASATATATDTGTVIKEDKP